MQPAADDDTPAVVAPAPEPAPATATARRAADKIIAVLLGLVVFLVIIGTVGNLWDRSVRVDVGAVTAILATIGTYAIAGKFVNK